VWRKRHLGRKAFPYDSPIPESGPSMIDVQESVIQVIVVSCSDSLKKELQEKARGTRWKLEDAISGAEALDKLEAVECHMLVLDSYLRDLEVGEFRELVKAHYPQVQISDVPSFRAALDGAPAEAIEQLSAPIREELSCPAFQRAVHASSSATKPFGRTTRHYRADYRRERHR
jgi:DNA-binding NtrC family response regulator